MAENTVPIDDVDPTNVQETYNVTKNQSIAFKIVI